MRHRPDTGRRPQTSPKDQFERRLKECLIRSFLHWSRCTLEAEPVGPHRLRAGKVEERRFPPASKVREGEPVD